LATPAVFDGKVFLGGGFGSYEFYALDAKTGKPLCSTARAMTVPRLPTLEDTV
jgi:outer membrane protein assembly factor BamB